jgi:hypothetical protein
MYKEILEKLPESIETLTHLRDLYLRHNQIEDALNCTLHLGDMFNQMDYVDKAENEYLKACAMDPGNEEAKVKLEKLKMEIAQQSKKTTDGTGN